MLSLKDQGGVNSIDNRYNEQVHKAIELSKKIIEAKHLFPYSPTGNAYEVDSLSRVAEAKVVTKEIPMFSYISVVLNPTMTDKVLNLIFLWFMSLFLNYPTIFLSSFALCFCR